MFSKLRGEYSVFLVFLSFYGVEVESEKRKIKSCEHMTRFVAPSSYSEHQNLSLRG